MKVLAGVVMGSLWGAVTVMVAGALLGLMLPPLSYLSGAALGLVTLRRGAAEALRVAALATAAVGLVSLLMGMGLKLPEAVLASLWVPVWALALVLRTTVSLPLTLTLAAALAWAGVVAVHWVLGDPAAWWRETLDQMLRQSAAGGEVVAQDLARLLEVVSQVMTGLLGAALVVSLAGNLFLARWWQALLYNPGGFQSEFHALRLPEWAALGGMAVVLLAQFGGPLRPLALDLMLVALALFFLGGLALVHWLNGRFRAHWAWLVGVYLIVLLFPQPMVTVLAATGFADAWLNLRGRLARDA